MMDKRDEVWRIAFEYEYKKLRELDRADFTSEEIDLEVVECAKEADRLAELAAKAV